MASEDQNKRSFALDRPVQNEGGSEASLSRSEGAPARIPTRAPRPFPYQETGADWVLQGENRYVAWEPGCGKSILAVLVMDKMDARKVLVLAPAHARGNWAKEIKRWQKKFRNVFVLRTARDDATPLHQSAVVLASYDLVSADTLARESMLSVDWDLLVLDEVHMLGSPDSNRTRFILDPRQGLVTHAKRVLPLSGTPVTRHIGQIFPLARALWPDTVKGYTQSIFEQAFCRVEETKIRKFDGSTRIVSRPVGTKPDKIAELRRRFSPYIQTLKTKDVLADMPPLRIDTHVLSAAMVDAPSPELISAMGAATEIDKALGHLSGGTLLAAMQAMETAFATQRRLIGVLKAKLVADLVDEELSQTPAEKYVIFAIHTQVIDILCDKLARYGVIRLDGSVETDDKQKAQDAFQSDPSKRVLVGQIKAAGTNLTLTASAHVILAEAAWAPGDNAQAIRRCHRIGQTRPVLARICALEGADTRLMEVLAQRAQELEGLFG